MNKFVKGLVITLISSVIFAGLGYLVLDKYIINPAKKEVVWETTRGFALKQAVEEFKNSEFEGQKSLLKANSKNTLAFDFLKKLPLVLDYSIEPVLAQNIYRQVYKDKKGNTIEIENPLEEGYVVSLSVPDFTQLEFQKDIISDLKDFDSMDEMYGSKLEDVLLTILDSYETFPVKQVDFIPEYEEVEGGYVLSKKSELDLINLCYNLEDFQDLLIRFAETSIFGDPNIDMKYWQSKHSKNEKVKPKETIGKNTVRCEWLVWDSAENKNKIPEPKKYLDYFYINPNFILGKGLKNIDEVVDISRTNILEPVGTHFINSEGVKIPVQVTTKEILFGQDAIDFLEKKNTKNRGLYGDSKLSVIVVKYELLNLSLDVALKSNGAETFALSDSRGNISSRTGRMFGIEELSNEELIIEPGQKKDLIYWVSSIDLDKKELIWGSNFENKDEIIFFSKGEDLKEVNNGEKETSNEETEKKDE